MVGRVQSPPGRALWPSGCVRPDHRNPGGDEHFQSGDRSDRLVRRDRSDEWQFDRVDFPKPATLRWSSRAVANATSGSRRRRSTISSTSGVTGPHRSGPRWPTTFSSSAVCTSSTTGRSTPVSRPVSIHSSMRRLHSGSWAGGPTVHEPVIRRCECSVCRCRSGSADACHCVDVDHGGAGEIHADEAGSLVTQRRRRWPVKRWAILSASRLIVSPSGMTTR